MIPALRKFKAAPSNARCQATLHMRDGFVVQCGRYRKLGVFCTQHSKIAKAQQSSNRSSSFSTQSTTKGIEA